MSPTTCASPGVAATIATNVTASAVNRMRDGVDDVGDPRIQGALICAGSADRARSTPQTAAALAAVRRRPSSENAAPARLVRDYRKRHPGRALARSSTCCPGTTAATSWRRARAATSTGRDA